MVEAVHTSETPIFFNETTRCVPEGCHLHNSYLFCQFFVPNAQENNANARGSRYFILRDTVNYVLSFRWPRGLRRRSWSRLVAGIEVSNPSEGMDVYLLCIYVVLSWVGRESSATGWSLSQTSSTSNCVWLRHLNTEEDKAQVCTVVP
jgi:hypothetical protein